MKKNYFNCFLLITASLAFYSCSSSRSVNYGRHAPISRVRGYNPAGSRAEPTRGDIKASDTRNTQYLRSNITIMKSQPVIHVDTKNVTPDQVIDFAQQQLGIPYLYGGIDPKKGFDCSGFINYVFDHFGINVPRITYLFTNSGREINIENSKPGDLVLFTGSNVNSGIVGHMGIITQSENGVIKFIHASSSRGIMISGMDSYFTPRFVKINRIFP